MNTHASAAPHHTEHKSHPIPYISNPFYAVFEGVKRLFSTNQTAAIIIMVISFVLAILQFIGDFIRLILESASEGNRSSSQNVLGTSTEDTMFGALGIGVIILIVVGIFVVAFVVNTLISIVWRGMLAYVALCSIQGKKASFGEGLGLIGRHFWALLVAQLVSDLKILGGLLLFIVPGIRAIYRYDMTFLYIFDKKVSGLQALNAMKDITRGRIIEIFGVKTMAGFAGIIPGGAEIAVLSGQITQYPQLVHTSGHLQARPKVHILNYLGFAILGLVLLLILGAGLLIGIAVLTNK